MATTINAGRVRFVSRGTYNNSTQYYLFDLVDYNGSSYIAKENTVGNLPTNTQYWQLIAEKGNTGQTGPVGPTGNGIDRIEKTATVGNKDTYTIYFTNGSTTTYEVSNGEVTREELEEEVDRLSMIYNAFPSTTGEGEEASINGTAEVPFKEIVLKGNTSQESYSGIQVFDKNAINQEASDKVVAIDTGIKLTNAWATETLLNEEVLKQFKPNTTYTCRVIERITARPETITGKQISLGLYRPESGSLPLTFIRLIDEGTSKQTATLNTDIEYITTFTTPEDLTNIRLLSYTFMTSTGANGTIELKDFMIVEGTYTSETFPNYEPYTGGNPAPNPDYPYPVNVVTGDNEVIVSNEDNTQSQTYPINLGSMELCKIGDYQDYFYKDSDKWYLHKETHKIVLNGTETGWVYDNTNKYFRCPDYNFDSYIPLILTSSNKATYQTYSNLFIVNKAWSGANSFRDNVNVQGEFYPVQNSGYKVMFRNLDYDNVNEFKTWLSTHNTIVYYVLATPTTTEITDTTLIEQLDNLEKAYSYDTQTNISQTNQDKPFIISYEAILSLKNVLNDLETRIAECNN